MKAIAARAALALLLAAPLLLNTSPARADYANDRAMIENVSNRYMVAVDAGDLDTVMSTWAEDGVLEWVFGTERGKAAIRKARPRTRHQIINHVIDVDGDKAKTIAYWFALTNKTPQNDVQLLYFGHYEDELVRIDGKWLFKQRRIFNESRDNRAIFYPGLGEKDPAKEPRK
jgi:hypothetical protein